MELFPNVHWLQIPFANAYLCLDDGQITVIDTGPPRQASRILDYVADLGRRPGDVTQIVITHSDWDHAGSVAELQSMTGATVYASAKTSAWLQKGRAPKHMPQPVAFLVSLIGRYRSLPAGNIDVVTEGDSLPVLGGLEALATPGHTPDHYAFYSPTTGVLFAGDALNTRHGSLGLPPDLITADVDAARSSAQRLLSLTPALFACGHGKPLHSHTLSDVMQLLQELKAPP